MIQGFSGGLLNRELIYQTDLPSFQRDFASLKTLNHGTGPDISTTSFRGSSATYFDADGVLQTAGTNVPRFDHSATGSSLGLLIEESRTNSIRNAQAGGAVAGVSGTLPANWSSPTSSNGLTREVVATGTINGMSYIDIRYSGTTTSASGLGINFETISQVAATNSQNWSLSVYIALVGGTITGLNGVQVAIDQTNGSSGIGILRSASIAGSLSSALVRYSHSPTTNNASITHVTPLVEISYANGQAIDLTLRIAAPQLEQGAFPTSYIPTTNAAATRAADSAVVTPISSFYNQAEGTLFAEGSANTSVTLPALVSIDDTTADERIQLRRNQGSSQGFLTVNDGGVSQAGILDGSWTTTAQVVRFAAAYRVNDFATSFNGGLVATDSSGTLPTVTRFDIGGGINSGRLNAHIRKIAYWPKRLTNTLLQQLTT